MRPHRLHVLFLVWMIPGLAPAISRAQAVPRTDTPRAGTLRVTFEPVITTWEREFTEGGQQRIGASLFSEGPPVYRCVRITFQDSTSRPVCRYANPIFVRAERRALRFGLDFGVTNRVSVGLRVPAVRVNTRASFLLDSAGAPADTAAARRLDSLLQDTTYAFGPISGTPRHLHHFAGDVELEAKYRLIESRDYSLSSALVMRLSTGHQDSPNRLFDLSTGDHQTDLELQIAQELTVFRRLWLNSFVRLGRQQPGTRERRVGPQSVLLIRRAALARLNWDPGDYAAIDVAPMYRFSRVFGVGFTAGYWTQQRDRYTYRSTQDSLDVATRLGAPVSAAVLNAGTGWRWARVGVVMTYAAPDVEGSFSVEKTVSGAGGLVPVATILRIVMRTSRWPF